MQDILSYSLLFQNRKINTCKIIILPAVMCACETWSHTLREVLRLKVSENRVLRGKFMPKRDEVTGDWRKPHNIETNDLQSNNEE